MNAACDILVGHGPKVSIIAAKDYKPFEHEYSRRSDSFSEESKDVVPITKKELVTDLVFEQLKKREEELAEDTKKLRKRKGKNNLRNKFLMDHSISFDEGGVEDSKHRVDKFRGDNSLSRISYMRTDESADELVTEDMFQRALAATALEIRNKAKKIRSKSRVKIWFLIFHSCLKGSKRCICIRELG